MDDQLRALFGSVEADVLAELRSLTYLHNLSAEDLYYKWESYGIRMDWEPGRAATLDAVRALKRDIQTALDRQATTGTTIAASKRPVGTPGQHTPRAKHTHTPHGLLEAIVPGTPAPRLPKKTTSTPRIKPDPDEASVDATPARTKSGEVVEVLNPHIPAATPPPAPFAQSRVKLAAASDQKKLAYKTMAMKLSEASEILDDRIDEFRDLLLAARDDLDASAFGNPAARSTREMLAVGRVASDVPDSSHSKLTASSVVLETSRRTGGGLRVPLDLSRLPEYALFPGQILAVRGTNARGDQFIVDEILPLPSLPNAASTAANLEDHRRRLRAATEDTAMDDDEEEEPAPLQILAAAGPYTTDEDLSYSALHAVCQKAIDTRADVVMLCGPFLDAEHPLLASGDYDLPDEANYDADTVTMNTVFRHLISPVLARVAAANPGVCVLLVPSVRDLLDKHTCWPQDSFSKKDLGLPKAVRIVTNPMTLTLNETVVTLSTQDILYELRNEELVHHSATTDADTRNLISRLPRYLFDQRHLFPLFPPSARDRLPRTGTESGLPPGASLDVGYLMLGEFTAARPDILLLPSALPAFARVIDNTVVVNPGPASRRKRADGTYALMTLLPPPATGLLQGAVEPSTTLGHHVFDRARVEITRI